MRPSDKSAERYASALRVLGLAFVPIAAAAKAAGDLDRAALEYAQASLEGATQWRRDLTATSQRHATGNATACQALAMAPVPGRGSLARQALAAHAAAVLRFLDGDTVGATRAADAARNRLYA